MMSQWVLPPLVARLANDPQRRRARARAPRDRWITPGATLHAAAGLPRLTSVTLAGAGHLAHEAQPEDAVRVIERCGAQGGPA